jgi:hypothetical protein
VGADCSTEQTAAHYVPVEVYFRTPKFQKAKAAASTLLSYEGHSPPRHELSWVSKRNIAEFRLAPRFVNQSNSHQPYNIAQPDLRNFLKGACHAKIPPLPDP